MADRFWRQPCAAFRKCGTAPALVALMPGEPVPEGMPAYVQAELVVHGWRIVGGRWVCPAAHPPEGRG